MDNNNNGFSSGKIDLEDESFDKKSLTFSELPIKILGKIVGKLDLVERLKTRKVSQSLRTAIDEQKIVDDSIVIQTQHNQISVWLNKYQITYKGNDDGSGCLMEYGYYGTQLKQKAMDGDFLKIAFNDLKIVLNTLKLELKELDLFFEKKSMIVTDKFLRSLESLKSPIHVRSLRMYNSETRNVSSVFSSLKSGTLEDIFFGYMSRINRNRMVNTDQWKQAKTCHIGCISIPIEYFLHFDRFFCRVDALSTQDVIYLRDELSKSVNFKYCEVKSCRSVSKSRMIEIAEALGVAYLNYRIEYRHLIPNSNEFLDFSITNSNAIINKRS